jgi:adenine phosphoribosyltransferase
MSGLVSDVNALMRDVPDFPKPGIIFKDITPILLDAPTFTRIIDWMASEVDGEQVDVIVGMESRGFIFGTPLVNKLDAGFVPARKPGKLPYDAIGVDYALEYGTARLEIHVDAIKPGQRVLIIDDLLATGGTAAATVELVEKLGGIVVACVFLVELDFLNGREKVNAPVKALIHY